MNDVDIYIEYNHDGSVILSHWASDPIIGEYLHHTKYMMHDTTDYVVEKYCAENGIDRTRANIIRS